MKGFSFLLFFTLVIAALNGTDAATKKVNITKNYYRILQLENGAKSTTEEIRTNFRKLALKFHPDKNRSKSTREQTVAEENFKEINEAYEVLSEPELKKLYDDLRTTPASEPIISTNTSTKRSYTARPVQDPFRWQYEYEMVGLLTPALATAPVQIVLSFIFNRQMIGMISSLTIISSTFVLVILKNKYLLKEFSRYSPFVKNILRNPIKAATAITLATGTCFGALAKLASMAF